MFLWICANLHVILMVLKDIRAASSFIPFSVIFFFLILTFLACYYNCTKFYINPMIFTDFREVVEGVGEG